MKPIDDLTDMLAEEVLSDMADSFFGSRVEIDKKMELFDRCRKLLKEKGEVVSSRAGFLNFLLIDKKAAADFFAMLKVKVDPFIEKIEFSKTALPEKMPTALTVKGEFVKLFLFGYKSLQKSVTDYVRGKSGDNFDEGKDGKIPVTYRMLQYMTEIINEKIKKVNERSTICTLQYTRQLNPEVAEKENITGGGFSEHGCDNLDKNLKFKPIKFEAVGIDFFPELPHPNKVKKELNQFAKNLFVRKPSEAKNVVLKVKKEIG